MTCRFFWHNKKQYFALVWYMLIKRSLLTMCVMHIVHGQFRHYGALRNFLRLEYSRYRNVLFKLRNQRLKCW